MFTESVSDGDDQRTQRRRHGRKGHRSTQVQGPRGEVTPLLLPSLVLLRWRKSPRAIRGYKVYEFNNGGAQATASLEEANLAGGGGWEDVT